MNAASALSLVIVALAILLAVEAVRVARRWHVGRPASVDWWAGLAAIPKRYLVDVHHVVARDPYAARMHALAAGGLLAGSALAVLGLVPPLAGSRWLWALAAIAFLVALAGGGMVGRRRYPTRPARLSGGAFQRLPLLLVGYFGGALLVALDAVLDLTGPLGWLGLVVASLGGFGLVRLLADGPMRHAFAGALHLAAHPRPGRFEGERATALIPADLDAPRLGVAVPADFAWNRLLGFDACIQCGRCEVACPAFAAGQPLNPKRLIQDLAGSFKDAPPAYRGSDYPQARPVAGVSGPERPIVGAGALIHPDTIWSCTTCRACVEECPMMIEHVDAIVDLRRFQTMELAAVPAGAIAPLSESRYAEEPGGRALAARTDFAAGLPLPLIAEKGSCDVLLWLGSGAYELRHGRTLRALVELLRRAGIDYAVLGPEERDCGDLARRLGDEATFADLARANIATLGRYRFNRILTADPHALHVLRNEYPAFGGHYEVVHHSALLDELAADGRLALAAAPDGRLTYHDPCYLGRYNGETDAPRRLLDRLGLERVEMERHGKRSMCCGGGGGAPVSDIAGERRIPDIRMAQARATGAKTVAVACPQCAAMLEGVTGDVAEVRDLAELVLAAVEAAVPQGAPR
ncbi:(Fe-S)-binding protein [Ancylobacter oerskovii]|uniref:(Fe-S)-binding protein n=1 Tax=Ancylobacter oerskovii TaxID=459519 RepID=A0ABW4YSR8_9HYPH|nr:(Fe-S)-binding protein [Ancylobacter oerskovii]MBS7545246.1 (Fe-S)-binding protein [Ancylobacter oerskovii]